jgi:hypothetical protein
MITFNPGHFEADPLAARTSAELLRDWSGTVNSGALFEIACELYTNEEFEHAAVLFRYLLVFRTRAASVWSWLGACLEAQGLPYDALLVYEAALEALSAESVAEATLHAPVRRSCSVEQRNEFLTRIVALRALNVAESRLSQGASR